MGKGAYLINYSIGYLGYIDEGNDANGNFTNKENAIGLSVDFGYDYWFSKNAALGVRLSLVGGKLKETNKTKSNVEPNSQISLSRLDISVGLRFGGK